MFSSIGQTSVVVVLVEVVVVVGRIVVVVLVEVVVVVEVDVVLVEVVVEVVVVEVVVVLVVVGEITVVVWVVMVVFLVVVVVVVAAAETKENLEKPDSGLVHIAWRIPSGHSSSTFFLRTSYGLGGFIYLYAIFMQLKGFWSGKTVKA